MFGGGSGNGNPTLRLLTLTSGLGCSIVILLLGLIGGGVFLDRQFGTSPVWTLVGVAAGVIAVASELIVIIRISQTRAAQVPFPRSSRPPDPDEDDEEA